MHRGIARRHLLNAAALLPIAMTGLAADAQPASPEGGPQQAEVEVQGRVVSLRLWKPAAPRGVILFSHGGNSSPEAYGLLLASWRDAGFLVVAPLHTDSLKNERAADHGLQAAFGTRIADLAAARAWAAQAAPELPVVAAGHSYGSLTAMVLGGALDARVHARDPGIRGVIAFSSPGSIPGLIGPASYSAMAAPLLLLTGDADLVPGFVTDWHDHLVPFQTSPVGAKYAWIGKDVDHNLVGRDPKADDAMGEATALSLVFLQAHALGTPAARATLSSRASTRLADFRSR